MVTGAALCDPEGRLLEEAGRAESPATHPAQPERNAQEAQWNLPTWEEIVRTHSARVYRLAYRLTGNPHDAEDLTQEVFVRVFRSLSSYTPGTFEGWLHRITTNLFLDSARRRQRIRFEGLADEMAHRLAGSEPTPGSGLRRQSPGRRRAGRAQGAPAGVPGRRGPLRYRGFLLRGDRRHPRGQAGHGAQQDPPRASPAALRARAPQARSGRSQHPSSNTAPTQQATHRHGTSTTVGTHVRGRPGPGSAARAWSRGG